jgi:hypothetical protein
MSLKLRYHVFSESHVVATAQSISRYKPKV